MAEVLGAFEQAVLLAVMRLREGAYGRAVLVDVQERLGREIAPGAIHITLDRLERKGLVTSRIGSGTPIRDGRVRRFYTVEAPGVQALNDARSAMQQLWRGFSKPFKVSST